MLPFIDSFTDQIASTIWEHLRFPGEFCGTIVERAFESFDARARDRIFHRANISDVGTLRKSRIGIRVVRFDRSGIGWRILRGIARGIVRCVDRWYGADRSAPINKKGNQPPHRLNVWTNLWGGNRARNP